jgi:sigma-B regulation protein RsbU (phosphoserine phosphatase)
MLFSVKKGKIKDKISTFVYQITKVSIFVTALITICGLLLFRLYIKTTNDHLAELVAAESQLSLEGQIMQNLSSLVEVSVAKCDEILDKIAEKTNLLVQSANHIIQNPNYYRANPIDFSNSTDSGDLSAQLIVSRTAIGANYRVELALLGNLHTLMVNIADLVGNNTSVILGSELGYSIIIDNNPQAKIDRGLDVRTRPWYMIATEKNQQVWSEIYEDAFGRGLVITCAQPFYDRTGKIAGVIAIDFFLDDLALVVNSAQIGDTGVSFILDDLGHIFVGERAAEVVNLSLHTTKFLSAIVTQESDGNTMFETIVIDRIRYFFAFKPLEIVISKSSQNQQDHSLIFTSIIEADEVFAPAVKNTESIRSLRRIALRSINITLILVIFCYVICFIFINRITRKYSEKFANSITEPVSTLHDGVNVIANGNFSHQIDICSGDEIEFLANAVNSMTADIRKHIAELASITSKNERIETELNVARKIQNSMLPESYSINPHPNFELYSYINPAKEVGGDFYDYFFLDAETFVFVIGDVSGKGVPAAIFMSSVLNLIRSMVREGKSPTVVCDRVNKQLCESNREGVFVTVFLSYLNVKTGQMIFVNAAHNMPIYIKKDMYHLASDKCTLMNYPPNFLLGILNDVTFTEYEMTLAPGDKLFLYTDGITEALNVSADLFTSDRLLELSKRYVNLTIDDFCQTIIVNIENFSQNTKQADDITMMMIEYKG